jgi:hypothetical protein
MNDKIPDLLGVVVLLGLLAGGAHLWFSHKERKSGFEEGSICQRQLRSERDLWTSGLIGIFAYDQKDPQLAARRHNEDMFKIEHADELEFVEIIQKIDFARRTGIARDTICLPDPKRRENVWPLEEYKTYDASLRARLQTDASVCHKTFEADVVEYLAGKFPCARND